MAKRRRRKGKGRKGRRLRRRHRNSRPTTRRRRSRRRRRRRRKRRRRKEDDDEEKEDEEEEEEEEGQQQQQLQQQPKNGKNGKKGIHVCGLTGCGRSLPTMMMCGKCKVTYYCNKQCQRAGWQAHKTNCRQESNTQQAREARAVLLLATDSEDEENGEEAEETKEEEVQEETKEEDAQEETKEEDSGEQVVELEDGVEAVEDVAYVAHAAQAAAEEDVAEEVEQENVQKQQEDAEATCTSGSFPNEFLCPITLELMRDPVVAKDGHTYERKAIEDWFEQSSRTDRNAISPKTGDVIGRQLTPIHAMRAMIGDEVSKRSMIEPALAELLRSLDLEQYLQAFADEGYDKVSDVRHLTADELVADVGIKKGHARRLARHFT
jgi:hypothetical protein